MAYLFLEILTHSLFQINQRDYIQFKLPVVSDAQTICQEAFQLLNGRIRWQMQVLIRISIQE